MSYIQKRSENHMKELADPREDVATPQDAPLAERRLAEIREIISGREKDEFEQWCEAEEGSRSEEKHMAWVQALRWTLRVIDADTDLRAAVTNGRTILDRSHEIDFQDSLKDDD